MGEPVRSRGAWGYVGAAIIAIGGVGSLLVQWYRARPLWVDEEMIALNVRDRSFTDLTGLLWLNQSAPVGWLTLQRALLVEFGTAERTLRAVPVIFGIATVILAFWVGRRWMGPLGAAVFVSLVSFAPFISYFPLEIKQYSADTFFGLLLPTLAIWAIEPATRDDRARMGRMLTWWLTLAVAQWFSLGALLVAPACAVLICGATLRRHGRRAAMMAMLPGVLMLTSFAVHYRLSIRDSVRSQALQEYWWWAYPPASRGIAATLHWLVQQIEPLGRNPGGAHRWIAFWLAAVCGGVIWLRTRPPRGFVLVAVPVTAFLFAGLHLAPLAERLALWTVPCLYAAVAVAADEGVRTVRRSFRQRRWSLVVAGVFATATAWLATTDIIRTGVYDLSMQPRSKHGLDDRSALRYLMAMREPGDAVITTRMGLPAVWWYGSVSVAGPNLGRAFAQDGGLVVEARSRSGQDCSEENLPSTLEGRRRVLVYLGFASRVPPGFPELVLDTLSAQGKMVAYRQVAEEGVAAAFDLTREPESWTIVASSIGSAALKDTPRAPGCVGFFPAQRW